MPLIKEMKYIDNGIWENQFNEKIKRHNLPFFLILKIVLQI